MSQNQSIHNTTKEATTSPSPRRRHPGVGGRRVTPSPFTELTANASLIESYGIGNYSTHDGLQMRWWELDSAGDGILMARLSAADIKHGDTSLSQVTAVEALARRHELTPRYLVVTQKNDSKYGYERRPDFALIEGWIADGASWLAVRGTDRLSRNTLTREQIFHMLRRTGTDLYVADDFGRKIDWDADELVVGIKAAVDTDEAKRIKKRMHSAIIDRYLSQGKGWPGSVPFGFKRDDSKNVVVDPEQWAFVEYIHYGLAGKRQEGDKADPISLREMVRQLERQGYTVSHEWVRQIARNPMYVNGQWHVTLHDVAITCKPVTLDRPIPEWVFALNEERHGLKRKGRANPPGTFILNHVEFVCGDCLDSGNPPVSTPKTYSSRLRAYRNPNTEHASYVHYPRTPPNHKGTSYPTWLGDAVMEEAMRLAEHPDLIEEWRIARRADQPAPTIGPSPDAVEGWERVLANLTAQRTQLTEQYVATLGEGTTASLADYQRLLAGVNAQIQEQEQRLQAAKTTQALPSPYPSATGETQAQLLKTLKELFNGGVAEDLDKRAHQAAVMQAMVSRVVVRREDAAEGGETYHLTLVGPLVRSRDERAPTPLQSAQRPLHAFSEDRQPVVCGTPCIAPHTDGKRLVNEGSPYLTNHLVIPYERLNDPNVRQRLYDLPRQDSREAERDRLPVVLSSYQRRSDETRLVRPESERQKSTLDLQAAWTFHSSWKLDSANRPTRVVEPNQP